ALDTLVQGGDRPVLLLAPGARAFDGLPAFDGIFRIYSWIQPLDPARLHVWDVDGVLSRETRAQEALAARGDVYRLSGPDRALLDARSEGRVSAQRMLLVAGEGSALLLGFALVAALGLRRSLANESRRLLQRGARRWQVWLAALGEVSAMTVAGAVAGGLLGVLVVALVAGAAGVPREAALRHALATPLALGGWLALWAAATVAVLLVARAGEHEGRRGRVRLLDVAAVGAVAAVGLALGRGGLDAEALASGSNRTLLLLLPAL